MDFYRISTVEKSDGTLQLRPDWIVGKTHDLMTRSGQFYAVWDEERKIWSTEIYDVVRLVDADLYRHKEELEAKHGVAYKVATMRSHGTKVWDEFRRYLRNSGDNSHPLDETLVFVDTEVKKTDYASKRLSYSLREGDFSAWDMAVGVLYSEEERAKIEWAIGAVVAGDSKKIQKFLVFYGPPGSGKGTVLNVIDKLFHGYTTVFNAKELTGNNNSFSSAAFKDNPLVGIQQDGDLSRIADNTILNSIVSHETLPVNEKYRAAYPMRMNTFLFMGTNSPVKITDAKSGLIRRLIDVIPTGQTIENDLYHELVERMDFELGAIAKHCLNRYRAMGKNFYSNYHPSGMMAKTDVFYNFVEACADIFESEDYIKLERAWTLYKAYCAETGVEKGMLPQYKFREELKNYFYVFEERTRIDGVQMRRVYRGFKQLDPVPPIADMPVKPGGVYTIELHDGSSYFDEAYSSQPAQYYDAEEDRPEHKWTNVTTTVSDIDTSKLHYVKIPENHIVIDFDIPGEDGEKDLEANLAAAAMWPPTYTELSRSGKGVHLHYLYLGDVTTLANEYAPHVEIKTLLGGASLRRKLTKCNNLTFMPISEGLPTKERPVLSNASMKSERALRELVEKNLRKEVHPGTKPSVDFIEKILDDAYRSGMAYNVTDLRPRVLQFASRSTHQADACIKKVLAMQFASESEMDTKSDQADDSPIIFFDVEVYPNLFMIVWKAQGSDKTVTMINPSAEDVGMLIGKKLVGFNNRRYDNHILYAAYLGKTVEQIYLLSYKIINSGNTRDTLFGEAYNLSYADIYDFSSVKMGLKKFQIKLGIFHQELDLPWDQPVPEELWDKVEEYCINDVLSTEAVFEDRKQDFVARQILAELSGLTLNHTTQAHTAKIIFGEDKRANQAFVYTNLADDFPGYVYGENRDETGKFLGMQSTYKGEVTGEGGYVYAEPGIYENVIVLDVASMHPTSIVQLNLFGPYTKNFKDLLDARLAIKNGNFDDARTMLDGRLAPYLEDVSNAKDLAYALKIVVNIVYGLTSAKFDNPFRDRRNHDNIVAKRGALFMVDLKRYMQERGYSVIHIKTDSIKLPVDELNVTHTVDLVSAFGKKYGYDFEHEFTYERMCLVNDAVYVAKYVDGLWTATGAQFQHPYVFKTLFSGEPLEFDDYCEAKHVVQGRMYLDFKGNILENFLENGTLNESTRTDEVIHVGRTGSFVPVKTGGADLWRIKDGQKYAVTGTKGYKWITRDMAVLRKEKGRLDVDMGYFEALGEKAKDAVCKYKYSGEAPFEGNSIEWFTHGIELSQWTGPKPIYDDVF